MIMPKSKMKILRHTKNEILSKVQKKFTTGKLIKHVAKKMSFKKIAQEQNSGCQ